MKIKKYKANSFPVLVIFTLLLTGCSDVLDKRDLNAISGMDVWNDEQLTLGYLNGIYENGLPDWPSGASGNSDDGIGEEALMYGELNSDSEKSYSEKYNLIYEINVLLDRIETGSIDENIKRDIRAQALFFRAFHYFNLVTTYGGVPLVLNSNKIGDNLEIPRNKTSECIAQILEDLNTAISVLPDEYDADNYGRITKGAAMAYKGRVLLFYASEQFDPLQSQSERWQDAYDVNKAALDALETQGKGLHPSFSDLWFDESIDNPEVIIMRKYATNKTTNRDVGVRPFVVGTAGENWDRPTLDLVESFPMKDGKSITDPNTEYTYDEMAFWKNRDPRFNTTIAYNGSFWELNDPEPQRTSPLLWSFQNSQIEAQTNARVSKSSFYCRKAVDPSLEGGASLYQSTTDWIEIRFAEVLLNYAEAANEIGNTDEAYEALRSIRNRAGIDAGSGNYGLAQGMGKDDMRDAVMLERRLEFAFEGKRSSDLRRRRMYAMLKGIHRKGFVITKTPDFDALNPSDDILDDRMTLENQILEGSIDLNNPETYTKYFSTVVTSVERDGNTTDAGAAINYQDSYYFFDLPQSALDKNSSLEQTLGWPGGSFDPLK